MNRVLLHAQIVERGPLRYTPAGLPALDLRLVHASQVTQANSPRQVSFEMHATAIGELVRTIEALAVGTTADFEGFLAKQRNGRGVMLHITGFVPHDTSIDRSN
ncbi:MAG: primosomal replication protein N [Burkholderiales bacterium]